MNAIQCKMARAATGLGLRDLAELAEVSPNTISRLERGEELKPSTVADIRWALECAGVEFIEENGGGAGVRLRKDFREHFCPRCGDSMGAYPNDAICDDCDKVITDEERAAYRKATGDAAVEELMLHHLGGATEELEQLLEQARKKDGEE